MDKSSWIYVASSQSEQAKKDNADFVCIGTHDELTLQKAIDKCAEENKNLFFHGEDILLLGCFLISF